MIKRIYFFKENSIFKYDPRDGIDRVLDTSLIGDRFKGLNGEFENGIDAAVNWGDGFVYLFKDDEYWKYDVLANHATTPKPRKIKDGWPTFPSSFKGGIDAAFNGGEGKAYFFKGEKYIRYHIKDDRVDDPDPGTSPYPRDISDQNGWRGLPTAFNSGIDAAVNNGDGKVYFFKKDEYVRLTFAKRSVDQVQPPYPKLITSAWSGLPANLSAGLEWNHAGLVTLNVPARRQGCKIQNSRTNPGKRVISEAFGIDADFTQTGYPTLCGCAEYRQFIRGTLLVNGVPVTLPLPDPVSGGSRPMRGRPTPGSADDNFLEDGFFELFKGNRFVGHRADEFPDPNGLDVYSNPDRKSGCTYRGIDAPNISDTPGTLVEIDLDFRGIIIDVCAGNEVLTTKTWSVHCSGVL